MTFEEWVDSKFKNERGEFMRGYIPENRLNYCLWGTTVMILKKVWEAAYQQGLADGLWENDQ